MKYDNATKQTARCWAWNQIERRVPKGSRVLVLIGDTDFELREGHRRGFEVIGIDNSAAAVANFRSSGGVALKDDLCKQLPLLNADAVIIDGTCGLVEKSFVLCAVAEKCVKAVVWNGWRGRDGFLTKQIMSIRKRVVTNLVLHELSNTPVGYGEIRSFDFSIPVFRRGKYCGDERCGKHRGMLLYHLLFNKICDALEDAGVVDELSWIPWHNKPEFYSYSSKDSKSNCSMFDSVAWTTLLSHPEHIKEMKRVVGCSKKSIQKAAAAKAVLTKRRNARAS